MAEKPTTEDEPMVDCPRCGGSGFDGRGTGYDDVCRECGGLRQMPARFYVKEAADDRERDAYDAYIDRRMGWD